MPCIIHTEIIFQVHSIDLLPMNSSIRRRVMGEGADYRWHIRLAYVKLAQQDLIVLSRVVSLEGVWGSYLASEMALPKCKMGSKFRHYAGENCLFKWHYNYPPSKIVPMAQIVQIENDHQKDPRLDTLGLERALQHFAGHTRRKPSLSQESMVKGFIVKACTLSNCLRETKIQ